MLFPGRFRRRTLLCALAAWAGAGAILPARLARGTRSVPQRGLPLDRTSAAIFERHLGSTFQIVAGSAAATQLVHLTGVTRSQTITRTNGKVPESTPAFSLIFRGPVGPVLVQDTYQVRHSQLGEFPLFLVPVGPIQAEACYEAVFA